MPIGSLILVETSSAGNLGAAMRVAANFAVPRLVLVRPKVSPDDDEALRWACGAERWLQIEVHTDFADAASGTRTLAATASGRGRERQPLVLLHDAVPLLQSRGLAQTAVVFGNETRGLPRDELDACDFAVRIPTAPDFPVLNLTQSVAIVLAALSMSADHVAARPAPPAPTPLVSAMMEHLEEALLAIGFLDPVNPRRIMRKLRRMFGKASLTAPEVAMFRGISRQILWAAKTAPLATRKTGNPTPGDPPCNGERDPGSSS